MNWILIIGGLFAVAAFSYWIFGRAGLVMAGGMFVLALICELVDRYAGPNWKWLVAMALFCAAVAIEWRKRKDKRKE